MKKYYAESRRRWNILHTIKRRKANWIIHILSRNSLQKRVVEGKTDGRIDGKTRKKI
jgi:hypothetical protein